MRAKLLGRPDTQHPAKEARVVEVKLGQLHKPLSQIGVKCRKTKNDKTGLQNAKPCFGARLGYSTVVRQRREVQQLRRAAGTQFKESLKCR